MRSRDGGGSWLLSLYMRLFRGETPEPDRDFDRAATEALDRAQELETKAKYLSDRVDVIRHR